MYFNTNWWRKISANLSLVEKPITWIDGMATLLLGTCRFSSHEWASPVSACQCADNKKSKPVDWVSGLRNLFSGPDTSRNGWKKGPYPTTNEKAEQRDTGQKDKRHVTTRIFTHKMIQQITSLQSISLIVSLMRTSKFLFFTWYGRSRGKKIGQSSIVWTEVFEYAIDHPGSHIYCLPMLAWFLPMLMGQVQLDWMRSYIYIPGRWLIWKRVRFSSVLALRKIIRKRWNKI
jgi:hypothetical protein